VATDLMIDDASRALALVLGYKTRLHVLSVDANEGIARGLTQGFMARTSAPRRVHRGQLIPVRVRLRFGSGPARTIALRVRVPRSLARGRALMTLSGTPADSEPSGLIDDISLLPGFATDKSSSPQSLSALARRVAAIHRFHGVKVTFRPLGNHPRARQVRVGGPAGEPTLRISGSARMRLLVR
jgi:hypothetical protein